MKIFIVGYNYIEHIFYEWKKQIRRDYLQTNKPTILTTVYEQSVNFSLKHY